ncbi:ATP-binding protein [Motiliproteus sp. SC1-56]|uniref:ATP-binding protein n=1 Tax=Motiliproteus sp. SC1-56 TaxID=2799565 RepID=UPI001A8EA013|nr:ATP-binding protein [Motiliproteus sp. SC1-56]
MDQFKPSPYVTKAFNYKQEHPLAYRILKSFLLFGVALSLVSATAQVYLDYLKERSSLESRLSLIESAYVDGLKKSLWDMDQEQVHLQLQGILNFPDIHTVSLATDFWPEDIVLGEPLPAGDQGAEAVKFHIGYAPPTGESDRLLGVLTVYNDQKAIRLRLASSALEIFTSQTLLILIIGLTLLVIFHFQVTRHLESMARYTRRIEAGLLDQPLELVSKWRYESPDELDEVVSALNDMRLAIIEENRRRDEAEEALVYNRDQLKELVHRRTQSLLSAKDAAESANRAKSQFLATMSHEIRTPLNGILGMVELLGRSALTEDQRHKLDTICGSGEALLEILNGLLDYARLEEGAFSPQVSEFSLSELVESTCHLFFAQAEERGISLERAIDGEVVDTCYASVGGLRQILSNLIANAIRFTEEGGVSVRVRQLGLSDAGEENPAKQALRFEVQDTGIGIPESHRERIFERFTQADESITRRYGGTGLGLAITRKLVLAMGGTIGVDSTEGEGSCFWFEIPMAIGGALAIAADQVADKPGADPRPNATLRILLVEDMPINQQVSIGLLSDDGHDVELATDGLQALELAGVESYDLILLDVHLPGLSGIEVAKRIRSNPGANRHTPIIALTASVQPQEVRLYLESGMNGVVPKPLKMSVLYESIAQCLDGAVAPAPVEPPVDAETLLDADLFKAHISALGEQRLRTLVSVFQKNSEEHYEQLRQRIEQADFYEVAELAHRLAGDADTLGAKAMARVLRAMEQDAGQELADSVAVNFDRLRQLIPDSLAELERQLKMQIG